MILSRKRSQLAEKRKKLGPQRAEWGGKIEFLLTCVGYAVGLGNIWRFPYLCYKNGGGAFLIPYFFMLAFVGVPIFFLELSIGQFASLGPIAIWKISPLFKGIGYTMVITNTLVSCYYNVIIAWAIYFLFASLTTHLPWTDCDNIWNTVFCATPDIFTNLTNGTMVIGNITLNKHQLKSASEEYFYRKVLRMSDDFNNIGGVVWQLACCLFVAWLVVFFVLIRGISSLGKVVYFTSIFPYILLTVLMIRGATLEGAVNGVYFYLAPHFDRLLEARVWSDAATQIFFSLATCSGGLIAMASYNNFSNNCYRDSLIVPLINCATSFYGGIVIFSVLGYMAAQKGLPVEEVAASGPGLVFVVYPEALSTMPIAPLWSFLFFLMMLSLGLSSMFSMVECFFCAFIDEFSEFLARSPRKTIMFRALCCIFFYITGLLMVTNGGFYLFSLTDFALSSFPLLVAGFTEILVLMYIYGFKSLSEDIRIMLGHKPNIIFKIAWHFVSPGIILATTIFMAVQYTPPSLFSDKYHFPQNAQVLVWFLIIFCISFIPIIGIWTFCRRGGKELLISLLPPSKEWGPALNENRTGKYLLQSMERLELLSGATDNSIKNRLLPRRNFPGLKSADIVFSQSHPNLSMIDNDASQRKEKRLQKVDIQINLREGKGNGEGIEREVDLNNQSSNSIAEDQPVNSHISDEDNFYNLNNINNNKVKDSPSVVAQFTIDLDKTSL